MARSSRLLWVTSAIFGLWCLDAIVHGTYINKLIYNNNGDGGYSYEFKTSDGTYRREDGGIVVSKYDGDGMVVRGEYGYIDPAGRLHIVRYIADRNGYQPQYTTDHTRFNDRRLIRSIIK